MQRTGLTDERDELWKSLCIYSSLTLLHNVGESIRVVQEWLVCLLHHAKPSRLDITPMSLLLLLLRGLTKDMPESINDLFINLLVWTAIDADFSRLNTTPSASSKVTLSFRQGISSFQATQKNSEYQESLGC
jgi:hypothetical protein